MNYEYMALGRMLRRKREHGRKRTLHQEALRAGSLITVDPTPSGLRGSLPAANWITETATPVVLLEDAPNQGTQDVLDVKVRARTGLFGTTQTIYDFNIRDVEMSASRRRSRSKQEVAQSEIDELAESWINGNRSFVIGEIGKMRPLGAALTAARIFEQTKDPSFMRSLEAKQ